MGDQNIGAFVQRLVISLPTRLPSSLLEMRSCLSIIYRVSRRGPQNCRSLGFARDDRKERATVHKEWLLNRGIWTFSSTKERSCLSIIFRVSRIGPQNCRSLGFARDDKKERATVHKRVVTEPRHLDIF